jgi:hypothetical protein
MTIFVAKRISKKTNKPYTSLCLKVGNVERILTMDENTICLALNVSPLELYNLEIGEYPVSERS